MANHVLRRGVSTALTAFVAAALAATALVWGVAQTPARAGVADGFVQIDVGYHHSCGVTTLGELFCWGTGSEGELGDGTVGTHLSQPIPLLVPAPVGETWTQVSLGMYHTCAIDSSAAAWCWGLSFRGQVGNGVVPFDDFTPSPSLVDAPGVSWAQLAAGQSHTCGIDTTGAAWCWGSDSQGQLGNGPGLTGEQGSPTPVVTPPGASWAFLDAGMDDQNNFGGDRTCGITTTGAGYCWGDDEDGGLGNGGVVVDDQDAPSPIVTPPGASWSRIRLGLHHACGVTTTGAGYCWGANESVQLGLGVGGNVDVPMPVLTPPGVTWTEIEASSFNSCGLDTTGELWCWGSESTAGELGNGTAAPQQLHEPYPVSTPPGVVWTSVVMSGANRTCALDADQAAWCWGADDWGSLGDGQPWGGAGERHEPSPVASEAGSSQQVISFAGLADRTIDASPFTVAAVASSGLPVSFTASGVCSVTGDQVTLTGLGSCSITASQAGDADWDPAAPVTRTFTVLPIAASITVSGWSHDYDGTAKAVEVSTTPPGLATIVTYDGSPSAPVDAGSYAVVVALDEELHAAADVTGTLTIDPAMQTITFAPLDPSTVAVGGSATATASASSGLPVDLAVAGPCSLAGAEVTANAVGTCTITATQPGDGNWSPAAPVARDLVVTGLPATLTVTGWTHVYDGSPKAVTVETDPDGLDVVVDYDGSSTPPTDAGSYPVEVTLVDDVWEAAPVAGTLVIDQAPQTIAFPAPADVRFGDAASALAATASSGLAVSFSVAGPCSSSGATVSFDGVGTCTVTATQSGDGNWLAAAPVVHDIDVAPALTTLELTGPSSSLVGTQVQFSASVTSAAHPEPGIVTFSTDAGHDVDVALLDGTATWTVQDLAVGTTVVSATYGGSSTHEGAAAMDLAHLVQTAPLGIDGLPAEVEVGEQVTVDAHGFAPGETVVLTLYSDPIEVGRAVADSFGSVSVAFAVPAVDAGQHELVAVGATSGLAATAFTTVAAPVLDTTTTSTPTATPTSTTAVAADALTTTGSLPVTGSSSGILAAAGVCLVALGSAALVAARRRSGR